MKKLNKTQVFLLITFVVSWGFAAIYHFSGGSRQDPIGFVLFGAAYMFIPMLSAIIVKKFIAKENLSNLLISFRLNKWFLIAWLLSPLLAMATFGISLLFPGFSYSPEMTGMLNYFESIQSPEQIEQMQLSMQLYPIDPLWMGLFMGLFAGISINAVAAFGEELGWRGFLLTEFKNMSFLKASILIGFIWGIWHAPIILMGHNYPQHPELGVLMMIIVCILLSFIFTYITIKAQSVIAASILHGTFNAVAGLAIMKLDPVHDLITGITGLAGFICLAILIGLLYFFDRFISKEHIFSSKITNFI